MYFKNHTFKITTLMGEDILLDHCVIDNMRIIASEKNIRITICDSSIHNMKIICENEGLCNIILRNNLIQDSEIYIYKDNASLENTFVTLISNTIHNLTFNPVLDKDLIHAFDNNGLDIETHTESWYEYVEHPLIQALKLTLQQTLKCTFLPQEGMCDVHNIMQNPELPTGCEITSLTIVLNYLGYNVNKETMAGLLDKAPIGEANPWYNFIGSPFDKDSYGCYTTCLERAALKFKEAYHANLKIKASVGLIPEELYQELIKGYPVIVWANMKMATPRESTLWEFDGHPFRWRGNEHCLVLTGYDKDNVYMSDPLEGNVSYDKNLFELRYQEMYAQSLIIEGETE